MDRIDYLERYYQLSEQSDLLRQRLSISSPSSESSGFHSPTDSMSPGSVSSTTPSRKMSSASPSVSAYPQAVAYSFPTAPAWPAAQAHPARWKSSESEQVDEANLYETNHQIKALLTDMLNCDAVRKDAMYRAWVQARLMDAEHELKRQRRRRSSAVQETIQAISQNLGGASALVPVYSSSF